MAEAFRFICNNCGESIVAWSDGNPYYIDDEGKKQYAYHPNHKLLARCIGNDSPHLCLACGEQFTVDSRQPSAACTTCGATEIISCFHLDEKTCPYCHRGVFTRDPDFYCVS